MVTIFPRRTRKRDKAQPGCFASWCIFREGHTSPGSLHRWWLFWTPTRSRDPRGTDPTSSPFVLTQLLFTRGQGSATRTSVPGALTGMGTCNGNLLCTQGPAAFTLSNLELPRRLGDNLELLLGRIQRRTSCQYTDLNLKCQVWNAGCPSWAKRQRKWQGPWGVSQRWVQDKTQDTSSENSGVEPSGKGQMSTSWRRTKSEPGRPMLRCPPRGPTESRSPGDEAERVRANGADEWGRRQARGGLRAWNAARARSLQPPVGSAHGRPHAWGLLTLSRHTGRGSRKLYYSEICREQGKKLLTLLLPIRELSFLLGILNSSNVYEADMIFSLKIYEWKD